jgi:S1-C subfamily serine protease
VAGVPLSRITHVNGSPVSTKVSVVRAVADTAPGAAIALSLEASTAADAYENDAGEVATAAQSDAPVAKLEKLPSSEGALERFSVTLQRSRLGFGMDITPSGHVTRYHGSGGPAELASVPLDSRIISIDGTEVASKADIERVLRALFLRTQHDEVTQATFVLQVETSLNRIMSSVGGPSAASSAAPADTRRTERNRKNSLMLAGQAEMHLAGDRHVQIHQQIAEETVTGSTVSTKLDSEEVQVTSYLLRKGARGFGVTCSDECIVMACTGAAAKARLPQFGQVVGINGKMIRTHADMRGCLLGVDSAEFEVQLPVSVELTGGPSFGLTCDEDGAVRAVAGAAQQAGIPVGSRIVALDQQAVESGREIDEHLAQCTQARLTLLLAGGDSVPSSRLGGVEERPAAVADAGDNGDLAGESAQLSNLSAHLRSITKELETAPQDAELLLSLRYVQAAMLSACRVEEYKAETCFASGDMASAARHFEAAKSMDPTGSNSDLANALQMSQDLLSSGATLSSFYSNLGL